MLVCKYVPVKLSCGLPGIWNSFRPHAFRVVNESIAHHVLEGSNIFSAVEPVTPAVVLVTRHRAGRRNQWQGDYPEELEGETGRGKKTMTANINDGWLNVTEQLSAKKIKLGNHIFWTAYYDQEVIAEKTKCGCGGRNGSRSNVHKFPPLSNFHFTITSRKSWCALYWITRKGTGNKTREKIAAIIDRRSTQETYWLIKKFENWTSQRESVCQCGGEILTAEYLFNCLANDASFFQRVGRGSTLTSTYICTYRPTSKPI